MIRIDATRYDISTMLNKNKCCELHRELSQETSNSEAIPIEISALASGASKTILEEQVIYCCRLERPTWNPERRVQSASLHS